MNFIIKALIIAGFLSYSPIFGQLELPTEPTPPAMETPAVTPSTPESVVEQIATPEVKETITQEIKISMPSEASDEMPSNGVNIGLSAEVRQKIATILNKLLSDEYVLYTKTLKFHWNVTGLAFHDLHEAFKEQYEKLFSMVDDIAERARALGAPALGSLQGFSTHTRLKEMNTDKLSALDMVKQLLADHEAIIRTLRKDIDETAALGDQGTSNFLQDLIVKHEKIAWMLRSTAAQ